MAEKEKRTWSSTGALSGRGLRSVEEESGEASVAQKNEERAGSGSFGQGDVGVERRARLCAPGARRRRWTPRRAETSYIPRYICGQQYHEDNFCYLCGRP